MEEMTRTERVRAAVSGQDVDRLPLCFWHHFRPAGSGIRMAEATLRFFDAGHALTSIEIPIAQRWLRAVPPAG